MAGYTFLHFCLLLTLLGVGSCGEYEVYQDISDDLCLVFTVAHGGNVSQPDVMTNGVDVGCFVGDRCRYDPFCSKTDEDRCDRRISKESFTERMVIQIAKNIKKRLNRRPKVIIRHPVPYPQYKWSTAAPTNGPALMEESGSGLDAVDNFRSALDISGVSGSGEAEGFMSLSTKSPVEQVFDEAWSEYDAAIEQAVNEDCFGKRGLVLDFIAHMAPEEWLTLGYLIEGNNLVNCDSEELAGARDSSSIRSLAYHVDKPFVDLLRGEASLGYYLTQSLAPHDLRVAPSVEIPHLGDSPYNKGGYTVRKYGSSDPRLKMDAVQVAIPLEFMKVPYSHRDKLAKDFADGLVEFMEHSSYI